MTFAFDSASEIAGWSLTGQAAITSIYGAQSSPNALYVFARRGLPGNVSSSAARTLTDLTPSEPFPVRLWVNPDSASVITLRVILTDSAGSAVFDTSASGLVAGWQQIDLGTWQPAETTATLTVAALIPVSTGAGSWLVDSLSLGTDEMARRREIREALVATIAATAGVGECVSGIVAIEKIETYPHVQVRHGEEFKDFTTLTRKNCTLSFNVHVFARDTDTDSRDDILDDLCATIEAAIEKNDDGAGNRYPFLGLNYVTEVWVESVDPVEAPELIERGLSLWTLGVQITYRHDRRNA